MSRATSKPKTSKKSTRRTPKRQRVPGGVVEFSPVPLPKSAAAKALLNSAHGKVTEYDVRSAYPKPSKKRGRPNYKAQIEALQSAGIESEKRAALFDSMHETLRVFALAAMKLIEAGDERAAYDVLREATR